MSSAVSVQDQVRPGECVDLFYYDGETSKKQCFPTTQNTKFIQQFQNNNGGSSVFTIPPNTGIQDVVCEFRIAGQASTGLTLNRSWGYSLIKQVSFRYGGSSQFFLTGDQIFQNALRRQTSTASADQIASLGGNLATSATQGVTGVAFSSLSNDVTAAVVLTLPHNVPSGVGKAHPFPTDLLTQQVQITVELLPLASIFSVAAGGAASNPYTLYPTGLSNAQFVVQQVALNNMGDSLARRVDMAVNAYAFPCEFVQQVQRIPVANSSSSQSLVLTGFRSGEVKAIHCWLTRAADTTPLASGALGIYNPFNWYLPLAIQMTYAGDIYARYDYASSPLWNLINGNKAPFVNLTLLTQGNPQQTVAANASQWVELPFAQTMVDEDAHYVLSHGKPITNGIVNIDLTTPTAQSDWTLNVSYLYNSTLLMSQGTCDYVF